MFNRKTVSHRSPIGKYRIEACYTRDENKNDNNTNNDVMLKIRLYVDSFVIITPFYKCIMLQEMQAGISEKSSCSITC